MATWTFFPSMGGEDHGLNNPGVEAFKGNLERFLAREVIQNSLDARKTTKNPVKVQFELLQLEAKEIPGLRELTDTLNRCSSFWDHNKKTKKFFQRAHQIASAKTVPCLKIGDSNTTGVSGADDDSKDDNGWYNLARCIGASGKDEGEGGSFGLGKHSQFACSPLLTVFYSTLNDIGQHIFQGVARLVTHKRSSSKMQPTGYFGGKNGSSIRNINSIAPAFRRKEMGTDVYVLGYHAEEDWAQQLARSVLENFWPAIHFKDLTVNIGGTVIDSKTLPMLMANQSTEKEFEAHLFYRTLTAPQVATFEKSLPTLKDVSLRLIAGDLLYPKEVALVRRGMVIKYRRFASLLPFVGLFQCTNKVGNEKLRQMEPPQHDNWDPDRPEKGENRKTEREFTEYIRECVKSLAPAITETILSIPGMSLYLPDDGDSPEDAFDGDPVGGDGTKEGLDRTPKITAIPGRKIPKAPPTTPGGATKGTGDAGADGDEAGDAGGESNDGDEGDQGGKGGSEDDSGDLHGDSGRTPIIVQSRAFLSDGATGAYSLTVHPPQPRPTGYVFLEISAVGDDSTPTPVGLKGARLASNRVLDIPRPGRVGPVQFPKSGPLRLEVTLLKPRRLALEITASQGVADEA